MVSVVWLHLIFLGGCRARRVKGFFPLLQGMQRILCTLVRTCMAMCRCAPVTDIVEAAIRIRSIVELCLFS